MERSEALDLSRWLRTAGAASDSDAIANTGGYVRTPDEQASIYGREEDAEEVTQEAFLRLHQALVAEIAIDSPLAWTLTVARRLMPDRLRHERTLSTRTIN